MLPSRIFLFILLYCSFVYTKKHKLRVIDDDRRYIALSTFGFYQGGILEVSVTNMIVPVADTSGIYGFTLDRTHNDMMRPYLQSYVSCPLEKPLDNGILHHPDIIYFKMNLETLRLEVECGGNIEALLLYNNKAQIQEEREKRQFLFLLHRRKRNSDAVNVHNEKNNTSHDSYEASKLICSNQFIPISKESIKNYNVYNMTFAVYMATSHEEGFYNLYFHNCQKENSPLLNFMVEIYESNSGNFLSAGDMPLPALYTTMSLLFALSGCFWCFILHMSHHPVYKIHILMGILVFLKALSLALHGVNYHFLQTVGEHVPPWAILYYITHLFRGALLFITIVLIGTGWHFIKHILADRDKKLFMIAIPLQVIANVAEIIIAESEEGAIEHDTWRQLFFLVDLLCCGAILFPIGWSIKHLQDASTTDGKALINLRKLKLFKHFYIMVVCYIYFTRIIAALLKKTVPFQYSWLDEMFKEMTTFVFFVLTAYKFRPASANPYFTSSVDYTKPQILSDIAAYDGIAKLSKAKKSESNSEDHLPLMENDYE